MSEIREKQQIYTESKPQSTQGLYSKAFNGSKANAIKAKCLDCTCDTREEIRECPVYTCPLWPVRPYQVKR